MPVVDEGGVTPVRVAIVGTGAIAGWRHLPALRAISAETAGETAGETEGETEGEVEVVAAVDIDHERLGEFCDEWSIGGRYGSVASMLAAEAPDLVVVSTPPALHREQVVEILEAGAWAWCEKPPALSLAEFDAMTAAERAGGSYAAVVFQQRFGSGAQHARQLMSTGALGEPLVAHCQTTWFRDAAYFAPAWRGTFAGDGGPAMAFGIHQIDLLLALLGPWREVSAFTATTDRDIETDDVSTALVRFENGALATVVTSAVSAREVSHLRIDTARATLEVTHLYQHRNADWTLTAAPGVVATQAWANPLPDQPSGHLPHLRALLDDLRAGRRPETSGEGGRTALELISAMYRSASTRTPTRRGEIGPDDPFYHRLDGCGSR